MSKLQRWLLVKRITHTYVLVVHVAEQLDFPQRPLGVDVVVEGIANLLDRNLLVCLRVHSRTDNAVGAAADGADGRRVLGGDLEEVPVHVVQHVPPAVRRHPPDLRATAAAAAAGGIHGFLVAFLAAAREGRGGGGGG